MLHAHCALSVTFPDVSCLQAFNKMKDAVETWHPEPNGANGTYAVWDVVEEEYIWATRTDPIKTYIADILFEFFGNPDDIQDEGCTINAKSRS